MQDKTTSILVEAATAVAIYIVATVVLSTGKKVYRKFRPTTPPVAA